MTTFTGKRSTRNMGVVNIPLEGLRDFEFHTCGTCGVVWGMPETFLDARRQDGEWWYCPNGHKWHWSGETVEVRLRRQLEHTKDSLASARAARDQAQASLRATKGVVTKMRKRVGNGVCPCCKRTFKDLARHMESQHPTFKDA